MSDDGRDDRIDRFRNELAELKTATTRRRGDQVLLWLSIILMVAGVIVAFAAYRSSHQQGLGAAGAANQNDMIVLAIAGLSLAVVGGALYLQQTLTRFLRFWLARQLYEQHASASLVERTPVDVT
jgi:hypothetical protein